MKRTSTGKRRAPSALDLMEPLRVCLGWSETVREASRRLREHEATAAPVIRRGRAVGLLTRRRLEDALLLGLADERLGRLAGVTPRRVAASAGLGRLLRLSRGTAPGLIVGRRGEPIRGFVTRRRILEARMRASGSPGRPRATGLRTRLARTLTRGQVEVLHRAGRLAAGGGLRLHLVGGLVRDILLGSAGTDLDLAVETDGPDFARRLAASLGGQSTVHSSFGTGIVTLPATGRVDVATMRREHYERAAALPLVSAGTYLDDLLRRDVTINAMAIRLDGRHFGTLVDEMGGREDLRSGTLRVHHLASICEDPTRAFRIARLAARLGFRPAPETLASIDLARDTGAFEALGGERLHGEFRLLAREPDPVSAVAAMARLDLIRHLGGTLHFDRRTRRTLARLIAGLRRGPLAGMEGMPGMPLLILMVLALGSSGAAVRSLAGRLKITGEMRDRLIASRPAVSRLASRLRRVSTRPGIVRVCDRFPPEALAVCWAASDPDSRRPLDLYLKRLRGVRPFLTGDDLERLGLPPGPAYRIILERLREARLDGRVRGRRAETALAERLVRRFARKGH